MLCYFWSVIRTKHGPSGVRGPEGETGEIGYEGSCNIDATKMLVMQQLNIYIDELYKLKSGKNILNQTTQKFPCTYLNNKISSQAGSKQYSVIIASLSNNNKPVIDLINYMKSIWKIWFDLIYDSNKSWFLDEHGDENASWVGENPFNEIKKYDMYYWGITRTFRPLKAELCRSTPQYNSSKLPGKPQARLKIMQSNDYTGLGNDWGGGSAGDISWWRANIVSIGSETYYPVGDMITAGSKWNVWENSYGKTETNVGDIKYPGIAQGPSQKSLLVSGDVVDPVNKTWRWVGGGRKDREIYVGNLVCPDGYVSMGDVLAGIDWAPYEFMNNNPIKCIPKDCVLDNNKQKKSQVSWRHYRGTGMHILNPWRTGSNNTNDEANGENGYNTFRIQNETPWYKIKSECLVPENAPSTKEPEQEFTDLGIGWHGHPYKLDPKYSIFTFLNLVPEGMIVNKSTGRRFYIIHYGGEYVNIYNVLDYSSDTDKFDNGLQVDSKQRSAKVLSRTLSRKDERQQWIIILQNDKTLLKLKNVMNNRYLFLGLSPSIGESQFSTIDMDFDNYKKQSTTKYIYSQLSQQQIEDNTTFTFISSFGTQMNIIDNKDNSTDNSNDIFTKPLFVNGNRIRISSQKKQPIILFGIFVYDELGNLITSMSQSKLFSLASSSSIYQGHKASNALKILSSNMTRHISQAIDKELLHNKQLQWNNYAQNGALSAYTNNDKSASTGGDWWEYNFANNVNISGIEIYCDSIQPEKKMDNMLIEIFNNNKVIWNVNTGTDNKNSNGVKLFIINTHGTIY